MTGDQYSADGRFRFTPANPFTRDEPRWWRCYVGNTDHVCGHGTLAQLHVLADTGAFDHLITPSTSLIHAHHPGGF